MTERLFFACDYMEGLRIRRSLQRLTETNLDQRLRATDWTIRTAVSAKRKDTRRPAGAPEARGAFPLCRRHTDKRHRNRLRFLKAIRALSQLKRAISALTRQVRVEFGGHKIMTLPHNNGKIDAAHVKAMLEGYYNDGNHDHMVMPGMIYVSHPTEYGTLYSRAELEAISSVCREYHIPLYLDGARLAYALTCPQNDITIADLASLCDVFYIGGTKCGALFGEAVVIPRPGLIPHFFTIIKQHGALLAKGRLLGIQFDALFTDGLYAHIGDIAIKAADRIRYALAENGYQLCFDSPTNQVFCILEDSVMEKLAEHAEFSFWEKYDDTHTVIRFATSWATSMEDTDKLCSLLKDITPCR